MRTLRSVPAFCKGNRGKLLVEAIEKAGRKPLAGHGRFRMMRNDPVALS
jgi:hypothetical protein